MKLTDYQVINNGILMHHGHDYRDLAKKYGTPLYIFDEGSFINQIKNYQQAIKNPYFDAQILYASKALLTKSIAKLIAVLGIGQDVVSAGEIYVGLQSGIDPNKMYFHGNNKLDNELLFAIDHSVGTIVVDNIMEARRLNKLVGKKNRQQNILLRVNPGIEASTHEYIVTATNDSKFGESIYAPNITEIVKEILELEYLNLRGFHSHIGSQIFDVDSFTNAANVLMEFASDMQEKVGMSVKELNFGGGFGVYYTKDDQPFNVASYLPKFIEQIHQKAEVMHLSLEKISIEPGRSLVNASGSTLYTIGDIKQTVSGKHYVFIDGGMTDNIRPALYQAKYEAMLPEKATLPPTKTYAIAGKACESGDELIESIKLPVVEAGDLLLVNGTGAYTFAMASNYNYIPRPAMIHIHGSEVRLTVHRDSYEDLLRNQF